jgi:hypothetical protein
VTAGQRRKYDDELLRALTKRPGALAYGPSGMHTARPDGSAAALEADRSDGRAPTT